MKITNSDTMKIWKIASSSEDDTYLIVTEASILITKQPKNANIDELTVSKKLGDVTTIKYNDVKEIIFIDTDRTIDFIFYDDDTPLESYTANALTFNEIKSHLIATIKDAELQEYSLLKQVTPNISVLGIATILIGFVYYMANKVENGDIFRGGGKRGIFKRIMASIGGFLGTTGTLILGTLLLSYLIYIIMKKIQNPKRGEVLKL